MASGLPPEIPSGIRTQNARGESASPECTARDSARRIGVYGGSFDPPHNAHLDIARTAMREAGLDQVLFVVAGTPPHKRDATSASAEERFAMVRAAVANEAGLEASRIELDREGPSYTVDTLEALQEARPSSELFLIVGLDSLVDLPEWRNPEGILARAELLVFPRPGDYSVPEELKGAFRMLPFEERNVSSTEVRERLREGKPVDGLVPEAVLRFIQERGVYGVAS